jgi:5'-nucleotidase
MTLSARLRHRSKAPVAIRTGIVAALISGLFAGCASTPPPAPPVSAAQKPTVFVKVIGFNDFHGNLKTPPSPIRVPDASQPTGMRQVGAGGIEYFSAMVNAIKAKNPHHVVVTAGDMVGATPLLSALFQDEPTIEAMNIVGIDFHAMGNHEFDFGIAHLKRLQTGGCPLAASTGRPDCKGREPGRENFAGANFKFLASNVYETATGKLLFPAYGVKEFDGVKVGFIGLPLRDTPAIVRPGGTTGVTFRDEVESVNALVPELKRQGIEAIVVVIHEGGVQTGHMNECKDFSGDLKPMVEKFDPAIDVVVSAHTHRAYVCNVAGKLVTSAGSNGTLLTEIDLEIDRTTRDVIKKTAVNVVVSPDGPKDARLAPLIAKYEKLAEPLENRVVAKVLREVPPLVEPSGESMLGNLIADAHLFATASPEKGGAVIAFNNPGSLRAPIIPSADGGVSYGALFKVQPFQNDLVTMNLSGKQIKEMLEQQNFSGDRPRLLGVSKGFSYSWDASKPRGERVIPGSMKLNGSPVRADLQYRVAANSFLAGGSEGMTAFRDGTDRQVGVLDLDALVLYLGANSPFNPTATGGRLTRLN